MPQNKRESLIYTTMVCAFMVIWMSAYNVTLHTGNVGLNVLREAWLGFPIAYMYAILFDHCGTGCPKIVPHRVPGR